MQVYYVFGFLLLVLVILAVTCAEISIVMCYFQLCAEDYNWWWRSFLTSGSSALYMFGYGILYFVTKVRSVWGSVSVCAKGLALPCASHYGEIAVVKSLALHACGSIRPFHACCYHRIFSSPISARLACGLASLSRACGCAQLEITQFVSTLLYFGYMSMMAFAFFLLTGTIGFLSCLAFVRKIYSSIKVD